MIVMSSEIKISFILKYYVLTNIKMVRITFTYEHIYLECDDESPERIDLIQASAITWAIRSGDEQIEPFNCVTTRHNHIFIKQRRKNWLNEKDFIFTFVKYSYAEKLAYGKN